MAAVFKPVKTKKIYEEIIAQIKQLIIDGHLQPGDKLLSERELAEKLKVSRASVREAFSAMMMMGLITIKPGEGSFIRQVSYEGLIEPLSFLLQVEIDDIMQLLEVRKIMETETASLAAQRADQDDVAALYAALQTMQRDMNSGDIGDAADAAFHFAVAKAAHNPILNRVMSALSDVMVTTFKTSRQRLYLVEDMPQFLYEAHREICEAIAAGNARLAQKRMHEHLSMVEEALRRMKDGGTKAVRSMLRNPLDQQNVKDLGVPS